MRLRGTFALALREALVSDPLEPGAVVVKLPPLAKLDLHGHSAEALCPNLPRNQREAAIPLLSELLHAGQQLPEAAATRHLGISAPVHGRSYQLQRLLRRLGVKGPITQQSPQAAHSAHAHVALLREQAKVGVGDVDAHHEHLRPSLAKATPPLHLRGNLVELGQCRLRLVLDDGPDPFSDAQQRLRPPCDVPDEVLVVVLHQARRDTTEGQRLQRQLRPAPVLEHGRIDLAASLEVAGWVSPEVLPLEVRQLSLHEEILLAVGAEDEHGQKSPLRLPALCRGVVDALHDGQLVRAEDRVEGHPFLPLAEVGPHESLDACPHLLGRWVCQVQVVIQAFARLHAQLALQKAEEIL
mmetsp:Transcript_19960/g.42611  ORF Transcript_19960/g.42611 Transcript_19960/m.42611 type:complete len:354 (-) Transcript_19960:98-1159(-)